MLVFSSGSCARLSSVIGVSEADSQLLWESLAVRHTASWSHNKAEPCVGEQGGHLRLAGRCHLHSAAAISREQLDLHLCEDDAYMALKQQL